MQSKSPVLVSRLDQTILMDTHSISDGLVMGKDGTVALR
jgi:hypothetical protein